MKRRIVSTDRVYKSASHLSQAARWGDLVWTGGIGPLRRDRSIVPGGIGPQAQQTLENLRAILEAAGTDLTQVLRVTVYLRRMEDFPAFEQVYRTFIHDDPPPRCTVACVLGHPASEGNPGMDIEIEAVAGVPQ